MTYNSLKSKVEKFAGVSIRPMFGYNCFLINNKFFVGFNNKNDYQVIVRLQRDQQELATKASGIKPFSHGAKMGWIEIDTRETLQTSTLNWIKKGYEHAKELSKQN